MAFKRSPQTPEERQQAVVESAASLRRMHDRETFRGSDSTLSTPQIIGAPVVEPMGHETRMLARDAQGLVTLVLLGDRSPSSVFEPPVEALSRHLWAEQGVAPEERVGVASRVRGVAAQVGWNGKRADDGKFRAIFVETMDVQVGEQVYSLGRHREQELTAAPSNMVDLSSRRAPVLETPGQPPAPSAVSARDAGLQAAEDMVVFGGRKTRSIRLDIAGPGEDTDNGGVRFLATNERGPVHIVLPGSRGEQWRSDPAGRALDSAIASGKGRVEAEGMFVSRAAPGPDGKPSRVWDFVASEIAFDAAGTPARLGRPITGAAPRAQEPVESKKPRVAQGEAR